MRYVIGLLVGFTPLVAFGCLWDDDTIKMERSRFPGTLELITGKFLRHSPDFYRWRIADRQKRLETDPTNVALLDDLAVAYHKIGRNDLAIETAERTERMQPGRYETAANRSTFLFFDGRLRESLVWVDRALAINPNAHFGREKYQKSLLEYILAQRPDEKLRLPLATVNLPTTDRAEWNAISNTFAEFLEPGRGRGSLTPERTAEAVKAVSGMMRFADHASPVLLEALGSLLVQEISRRDDAKMLAARAYLKAADGVIDPQTKKQYRCMADAALYGQVSRSGTHGGYMTVAEIEAEFRKEQTEANAWYAELEARERSWIAAGLNPEVEFDKLYPTAPEVSGMDVRDPLMNRQQSLMVLMIIVALIVLAFMGWMIYLMYRVGRRLRIRWHRGSDSGSSASTPR